MSKEISAYAQGGIFYSATVFGCHADAPEAVIPRAEIRQQIAALNEVPVGIMFGEVATKTERRRFAALCAVSRGHCVKWHHAPAMGAFFIPAKGGEHKV